MHIRGIHLKFLPVICGRVPVVHIVQRALVRALAWRALQYAACWHRNQQGHHKLVETPTACISTSRHAMLIPHHAVACQVVHPALRAQLHHDGIDPRVP